ncbi:MAG: lipid A phosphoethanolamine transferase [Flavobacterium sp.]
MKLIFMSNLLMPLALTLLSVTSIQAQDKREIREGKNPFSEARFNYFKETIILFNEYLDTKNGSFNTTAFRIVKPIGSRAWTVRLDAPLVSTNTNSSNKSGLGDLSFATSYLPLVTKKSGIATRLKLTTNSAVNSSFGQGKWIIAPSIFYGRFLDKNKKIILISDVEYQHSFAGSDKRAKVRIIAFENTILYSFSKSWVSANASFRYNDSRKGFQNSSFVEFGRKLTPDALFYIHPSAGFGNKKLYNYGFELGMIILF